jgi:hypothetical protein
MTSGTEKRVRDRVLPIRLSADERAAVEAAAEKAGLTASSYARQVLLGAPAPRQVRRPPVEKRELVRLLGGLGNVRGNLNQLAKAVHTGILIYSGDIDAALAALAEVRAAILAALGRAP